MYGDSPHFFLIRGGFPADVKLHVLEPTHPVIDYWALAVNNTHILSFHINATAPVRARIAREAEWAQSVQMWSVTL